MEEQRRALEECLVQQWKEIEELEADDGSNVDDDRFKVTKEQWFLQAFAFLRDLPEDSHCWCGHKEIMLPLLEPFYLYYEETSSNSSLRVLWSRLCKELRSCTSCVVKHHQAKAFYISEFMEDVVKPLLDILRALDEERVAGQMKELVVKFDTSTLDPNEDSAGVICVMFEVFMFPLLLEDAEVNDVLKPFLLHVEETHDLSLASGQRYPGVYSLLCHADQGVRRIALKLAHSLPTFKDEQDLESVQPFLQKCLHCLEYDAFESSTQRTDKAGPPTQRSVGRPRVGFSKEALWIGLTTVLGVLEAPAFLKGVLERYPVLVSIVLNHVSEATSVFWNALRCLKLLLEVLGYKLWLGTTFSPGVMRNTLLSQCFHSHEERMHVHIFDLFQPFLQSLEALQDGEYENQRRRLLYFLLQQVPCSSNFKPLMTKKARQVAFSIIGRGYTLDPPLPPVECVHVWGPALVATLQDTYLIKAVRQSAIDLMQSIFVADAVAMAAVTIQQASSQNVRRYMLDIGDDDFDSAFEDEVASGDAEVVADIKYSMSFLSVTRSVEACEEWSCLPLLWIEVLNATMPVSVPLSFTKAIMWALSRLSLIDLEGTASPNNLMGVGNGIACSDEILSALQWAKPKGYDDGAGGEGCVNAVKTRSHLKELVGFLKRHAEKYVNRLGDGGLDQQGAWTWEPRMAEPIILLLLDANAVFKEFGKDILRHTANASTLESGLELLCTCEGSAAAVSRGLHYASKLLLRWPLTQCTRGLQQLYFHVWKLFTLGETPEKEKLTSLSQVSHDGGFLSQPEFPTLGSSTDVSPSTNKIQKDEEVWSRLCRVVASHMWPLLEKTLFEGRQYVEGAGQLMTFTRMLQLLPLVCRHLVPAHKKRIFTIPNLKECSSAEDSSDLTWFQALVRWGDIASAIIQRWWKEAIVSILDDLKGTELVPPSSVEEIILEVRKPGFTLDERCKLQLSTLLQSVSTSLKSQGFLDNLPQIVPRAEYTGTEGRLSRPSSAIIHHNLIPAKFLKNEILSVKHPVGCREIIDLTEDEDNINSPYQSLSELSLSSDADSVQKPCQGSQVQNSSQVPDTKTGRLSSTTYSLNEEEENAFRRPSIRQKPSSTLDKFLVKVRSDQLFGQGSKGSTQAPHTSTSFKPPGYKKYSAKPSKPAGKLSSLRAEHRGSLEQRAGVEDVVRMQVRERVEREEKAKRLAAAEAASSGKNDSRQPVAPMQVPAKAAELDTRPKSSDATLRELVSGNEVDPLDAALENVRKSTGLKDLISKPRRRLVRLELPGEGGKGGALTKTQEMVIKPRVIPRMDEWYRRILSLNYLSLVGVGDEDMANFGERLEKVPLIFKSPEHYMEIFRPLLMEEFKAQMKRSHEELNLSDKMTTGVVRLMSMERVDDFQLGRFMAEAGSDAAPRACAENDLILLSRQPITVGEQSCHLLAKVESRERESKSRATILLMKICIQASDPRLTKAKRLLVDRSKWHLTRVMNISPQLRECQALSSVSGLPLLPVLLTPDSFKQSKSVESANSSSDLRALPEALQDKLTTEYNDSQIRAIACGIGGKGAMTNYHQLTLVQGPPGTGKTKTIVAILSALLAVRSSRRNPRTGKENSHIPSGLGRSTNMTAAARTAFAVSRSWQDAALAKQLMKDGDNGQVEGSKQRVLVCAQSNAAVDEIVARILKNGLYGADGSFLRPSIVRIGAMKSVHPNSLPVFIDTIVDQRLGAEKQSNKEEEEEEELARAKLMESRSKLEEIIEFIQVLEALQSQAKGFEENEKPGQKPVDLESDLASKAAKIVAQGPSAITGKLNLLYRQRREISAELAIAEKESRQAWEESQNKRKAIRKDIIRQADVVVTTLSGCGGDIYTVCMESIVGAKNGAKKNKPAQECFFDAVVIDEAGQALEPATLIPFQLLAQTNARCVMVGDPKQLPATVLSQVVGKMAYERSMFERLQRAGYPVTMLSTQYRMHPEIRQFPSAHFYGSLITDGPGLKGTRKAVFHRESYLGPYAFFDVVDGQEGARGRSDSQSVSNEAEVDVVLQLYLTLKKRYPAELWEGRVGVITPYKQQLRLLQEQFARIVGAKSAADVEFNTVDGFQGREVDIIILSTVRASQGSSSRTGGIGFVADVRRMNVALTRARFSCWVVGNAATLRANPSWDALLKNAKRRSLLFPVQKPYSSFFQKKGPPPVNNDIEKKDRPATIESATNVRTVLDEATYDGRVSVKDNAEVRGVDSARREGSDKGSSEGAKRTPVLPHKQQGVSDPYEKDTRMIETAEEKIAVQTVQSKERRVELLSPGTSDDARRAMVGNHRHLDTLGDNPEDSRVRPPTREEVRRSISNLESRGQKEEKANDQSRRIQDDRSRSEEKKRLLRLEGGERTRNKSPGPSQPQNGTTRDRPPKMVKSVKENRSDTDQQKAPLKQDFNSRNEKSHGGTFHDQRYLQRSPRPEAIRHTEVSHTQRHTSRHRGSSRGQDIERAKHLENPQGMADDKKQERLLQAHKYLDRSASDLSQPSNVSISKRNVERYGDGIKTGSADDRDKTIPAEAVNDRSGLNSTRTKARGGDANLSVNGSLDKLSDEGSMQQSLDRRTFEVEVAARSSNPQTTHPDIHSRSSFPQNRRTSREDMNPARKRQREEVSGILYSGLLQPAKKSAQIFRDGRPLSSHSHSASDHRPGQSIDRQPCSASTFNRVDLNQEWDEFQKALQASKSELSHGGARAGRASPSSSGPRSKTARSAERPSSAEQSSTLESILSGLSTVTRAQVKGGYTPTKPKDQPGGLGNGSQHP